MSDLYLPIKLLHIAAVIAFLGNIVTGLFWHALAARTRDPRLLAHTMAGIIRSDRLFTMPGVVAVIATGAALARLAGLPLLGTPWILWTLVLFAASGAMFAGRVAPLQRRLQAMAVADGFDWPSYRRIARNWEAWGAAALLTPLGGLVLMVLKPA